MKTNEMQTYTTNLIAQQLQEGYILEWDDSSRGYKSVYWLRKGDVRRCLCVKENGGFGGEARSIGVFLFDVSQEEQWVHEEDHQPLIVFYQMGKDWYTTDAEEAAAAKEKNMQRYRNRHSGDGVKQLQPTDAVTEAFRAVFGLEKMPAKNLRITRSEKRLAWRSETINSYEVTLLNRLGNAKETRTYRLGSRA